ncbi:MAG: hypothetical protein AB7N91_17160 [Candidatus Tectimicrobiota bacterium]
MRYYDDYPAYVPVAERRARAERKLRQLQKTQPHLKPVRLTGQSLATTWWGKSWNTNLERYADYSNRIDRGRSYVRHHCVLDLQLTAGRITALVQGSRAQPYKVVIKVDPLQASHWATIRAACAGSFDSLRELLAGTFPQALKDLFFAQGSGLFPAPRDIHFDCSCPDWASMCKHVAAALYGVGSRLDDDPGLFFTLRGINIDEIIAQTVTDTTETLLRKAAAPGSNILPDVDLGDVFGLQFDASALPVPPLPPVPEAVTPRQSPSRPRSRTSALTQPLPSARPARREPPGQLPGAQARARQPAASVPVSAAPRPAGTMLEALLTVLGKTRKGKALAVLQNRLGWTHTQLRNTLSRATAKGLVETVTPGVYRRKV